MGFGIMLDVGFYFPWNKSLPRGAPPPLGWLTLHDTHTSAHKNVK